MTSEISIISEIVEAKLCDCSRNSAANNPAHPHFRHCLYNQLSARDAALAVAKAVVEECAQIADKLADELGELPCDEMQEGAAQAAAAIRALAATRAETEKP